MVFCAHSDDQIFGPGGTMAKYARNGDHIINVVFTYGEMSHPWIKRRVTAEIREAEAIEADKIIGGKDILFMGISEATLVKDTQAQWVLEKIEQMIKHFKPNKIFTHSLDDPHAGHRSVCTAVLKVVDKMKFKGETYSFDVWNPLNIRWRNSPKLYVDITDTFELKIKALKSFKSQWMAMLSLMWSVYFRALILGLENGTLYAERFYRIR
jgi:N-acetylglucosamine malate deacetylase 1